MLESRDTELEDFKRKIDLRDYAAGQGFEEDRRASSINSTGMKHPDGSKIIVGMGHDDHWIYFSVHDPSDSGSIIDFVQNRQNLNLGQVRRELRPWEDGRVSIPTPLPNRPTRLKPVVLDLHAVRASYALAQSVYASGGTHDYLNGQRALTRALLASERFKDRVAIDGRGNALFPHFGQEKNLVGFEIKNENFTGYSPGGQKGLWISAGYEHDRRLVIAETAIDALSYAALFDDGHTRYASIAGQMNPHQPGLLHRAIRAMPKGSEIVLGVDHDEGGTMLGEYIEPVFTNLKDNGGRDDLTFRIHQPEGEGQDWNDQLRTPAPGISGNVSGGTAPLPSSSPE